MTGCWPLLFRLPSISWAEANQLEWWQSNMLRCGSCVDAMQSATIACTCYKTIRRVAAAA
jgi:hypothetical protein